MKYDRPSMYSSPVNRSRLTVKHDRPSKISTPMNSTVPMLPIGNLPKLRDVARQVGDFAELPVALSVCLDLVHRSDRDLLCQDDGLGHVMIVILNEITLVTQNWVHLSI